MNQTYHNNQYESEELEEPKSSKAGIFIGLAFCVIAAVVLGLILKAARPAIVSVPTAYTTFNASDGAFSIQQPVGWDSSGSASGAIDSGALFKSGAAKIDVTADLAGSLMGDMAQAQNNQMENLGSAAGVNLPPPPPPVEKVHMMGKQAMEDKYKDYNEGDMKPFVTKIGAGRVSEFTADGGMFLGKLHGYRATVLSNERRITIITLCPEANWAALQPAFQQIILSIDRGKSQ